MPRPTENQLRVWEDQLYRLFDDINVVNGDKEADATDLEHMVRFAWLQARRDREAESAAKIEAVNL